MVVIWWFVRFEFWCVAFGYVAVLVFVLVVWWYCAAVICYLCVLLGLGVVCGWLVVTGGIVWFVLCRGDLMVD